MTDPRPICPIPPDAKVGDFVVLGNGERCAIERIDHADERMPYRAGGWWMGRDGVPGVSILLKAIAFIYADGRKPNLPSTGKPKRTQAQRDAAWLRKLIKLRWVSDAEERRMLAIADRLEKQQ